MHILIGALVVAGTFLLSLRFMTRDFDGFWNLYSMLLLSGVPIGLSVMTYRFSTLGAALRGLADAVTHRPERDREQTIAKLVGFGREVRRDRGAAAASILEGAADPVFRHLGQHVLQSTDAEEIEADALMIGRRSLEPFRAGERVLSTLGNTAPAIGMIGTVIGLIQLLVNMNNFEQLGSGMAIALLTTFYGLILGHGIYLPLARMVADHGLQRADTMNLVIDGMLKLARRRPLREVQEAVGGGMGDAAELSPNRATAS